MYTIKIAELPADEKARVNDLLSYEILDTLPEADLGVNVFASLLPEMAKARGGKVAYAISDSGKNIITVQLPFEV